MLKKIALLLLFALSLQITTSEQTSQQRLVETTSIITYGVMVVIIYGIGSSSYNLGKQISQRTPQ